MASDPDARRDCVSRIVFCRIAMAGHGEVRPDLRGCLMLMLLEIFAALLAVSAAVVWLSARSELSPDGDHRHSSLRFPPMRLLLKATRILADLWAIRMCPNDILPRFR